MKILEKYNKTVQESGAVCIAFFGDSVSQGYFESGDGEMHSQTDAEAVYHNRLHKMLSKRFPFMPTNIINASIGGEWAGQGLERIDRDVIAHRPDLCVVAFGLNGVSRPIEEYTSKLEEIFDRLHKENIETIYMTTNMFNTYVADDVARTLREIAQINAGYQTSGRMDRYMDAAKNAAKKMNVPICDCYAEWKKLYESGKDTTLMLANRINHPCREQHQIFADKLYEMITGEKYDL